MSFFKGKKSKAYYYLKNTRLYLTLLQKKSQYKKIVVSKDSDFVIEGFPRSANTFFTKLIKELSGNELKIARHVHSRAQLMLGIKYDIPTILLIRNPADAITSLLIKSYRDLPLEKMDQKINSLIHYYIYFHNGIYDHDEILILQFPEITGQSCGSICRINSKFDLNINTDFNHEEMSSKIFECIKKENLHKINNDRKELAIPSKEKVYYKEMLLPKVINNPNYKKAEHLFKKIAQN